MSSIHSGRSSPLEKEERQVLLGRLEQEVKARHQLSKQILVAEEGFERQRRALERYGEDQEARIEQIMAQFNRALQDVREKEGVIQEERDYRYAIESRLAGLLSRSIEANASLSPHEVLEYISLPTAAIDEMCVNEEKDGKFNGVIHSLWKGTKKIASSPNDDCKYLCQPVQWCPACGPPRVVFSFMAEESEFSPLSTKHSRWFESSSQLNDWQHERMKLLLEMKVAKEANETTIDQLNQQVFSLHNQLAESKAEIHRMNGLVEVTKKEAQTTGESSRESEILDLNCQMDVLKMMLGAEKKANHAIRTGYAESMDELMKLRQFKLVRKEIDTSIPRINECVQMLINFESLVNRKLEVLEDQIDRLFVMLGARDLNPDFDKNKRSTWKFCCYNRYTVTGTVPGRKEALFGNDSAPDAFDVEKRLSALSFAEMLAPIIIASPMSADLYIAWSKFVREHLLQLCSSSQMPSDLPEISPLSKEVFTQVIKGGFAALYEQCPGLILEVEKIHQDSDSLSDDSGLASEQAKIQSEIKLLPLNLSQVPKVINSLNYEHEAFLYGMAAYRDRTEIEAIIERQRIAAESLKEKDRAITDPPIV